MAPLEGLKAHDRDFGALRRATRAAIVMPGLFVLCSQVLHAPVVATFAAFGSFALLLLLEFSGTLRARAEEQLLLGASGAVLVALGTLVSRWTWLAVLTMAVVAALAGAGSRPAPQRRARRVPSDRAAYAGRRLRPPSPSRSWCSTTSSSQRAGGSD